MPASFSSLPHDTRRFCTCLGSLWYFELLYVLKRSFAEYSCAFHLQMSLPSDEDVAPEQFPSLLSASLRSNVFNPDFLDRVVESHVQDRAEAHVQARGLESHPSLARKVTSRAPALIDHAIAQALNEELATTMPRKWTA